MVERTLCDFRNCDKEARYRILKTDLWGFGMKRFDLCEEHYQPVKDALQDLRLVPRFLPKGKNVR